MNIYIYIYILSVYDLYLWLYGQMEPYTIQGAKLLGVGQGSQVEGVQG